MKILFLTPCVPTYSDGRRPFNFLRYLAARHEVHLLCFRLPPQTPEDVRKVQNLGVRVTTVDYQGPVCLLNCGLGLPIARPFRVSWCRSPEFRASLERILAQQHFDLAHIDRMRMGQYIPQISIPSLVDFTDSLVLYLQRSLVYRRKYRQRFIDAWELRTIPRYERWLLKQIDAALVCSPIDAAQFNDYHPGYRFDVIENAVDAEQFKPKVHGSGYASRCVLTGTLFYFANIDSILFYREKILPLLRKSFPDLETQIIGTRPTHEIRKLDGRKGIQVLADVPNMADYLYQDDMYLCPLRVAAGVRNKLLEAMAAGMAVVTTRLGAEGTTVQHDREVLFAETPEEFVQCVQQLKDSPELRRRLGEEGRKYVLDHHQLDILGRKLEILYERMLKNRS